MLQYMWRLRFLFWPTRCENDKNWICYVFSTTAQNSDISLLEASSTYAIYPSSETGCREQSMINPSPRWSQSGLLHVDGLLTPGSSWECLQAYSFTSAIVGPQRISLLPWQRHHAPSTKHTSIMWLVLSITHQMLRKLEWRLVILTVAIGFLHSESRGKNA
jgi:hypothetical protein